MLIFLNVLVIIVSFYIMAIVCDSYFIVSLDIIAQKLKMNSDMAGATLMAIGSSAPELFIALFAVFKPGNEAIGVGTIVGSALFNILVIVGASAMIKKVIIPWQPVIRDFIFYAISILLLIFFFRDGNITIYEVIIFMTTYLVYIIAVINWRKYLPYKEEVKNDISDNFIQHKYEYKVINFITSFINKILAKFFPNKKHYRLIFFISIIFIMLLSWVLVQSAITISVAMHVPSVIIGLTVLAIGTSIPDLLSSIIVVKQGRGEMAISNAMGSNIFDILVGLSFPWFIAIIFLGKNIHVSTVNLNSSIFLLLATIIVMFFLFLIKRWRLGKKVGFILIGSYIIYLIWVISHIL